MPSARRPAPDAARPRVTYLVGRLNRVLRRRLGEALTPYKLSVPQYTTLSVLHARGNLSNAELAKRAFISPQAMNEVIQGLEARKLVARQASASHGRIVQLLLTQQGLDVMHGPSLLELAQPYLHSLDPSRAGLVRMALGRLELIQREGVLLMMPELGLDR